MSNFLPVFVQLFTSVHCCMLFLFWLNCILLIYFFFQITARSDPVPYHWAPRLQSLKLL